MKASKRFLTAAIALIFILVMFAGCGGSDDNMPTYGNVTQDNNLRGVPPYVQNPPVGNQPESSPATTPPPTDSAPTTAPAPEATPVPTPEPEPTPSVNATVINWDEQNFSMASVFSQGRAWVTTGAINQPIRTFLIDTEGNIYLTINEQVNYVSTFEYGTAFFITGGLAIDDRNPNHAFHIVKLSGEVTYSSAEHPNMIIFIARGGEHFLVTERIDNQWRLRTIDRYGNDVFPYLADNDIVNRAGGSWGNSGTSANQPIFSQHQYLGNNIFALEGITHVAVYDAANQTLHELNRWPIRMTPSNIISPIIDGSGFLIYTSDYADMFRRNTVPTVEFYDTLTHTANEILRLDTSNNVIGGDGTGLGRVDFGNNRVNFNFGSDEHVQNSVARNMFSTQRYSEGLFWHIDAYYNRSGERVIEFPQFEGYSMYGSPFENGFAALYISHEGWNSNRIVNLSLTIIDVQGNVLFEPINVECANMRLSEGYVVFATRGEGIERIWHLLNVSGDVREIIRSSTSMRWVNDVHEGFVIASIGNFTFLKCVETGRQIGAADPIIN